MNTRLLLYSTGKHAKRLRRLSESPVPSIGLASAIMEYIHEYNNSHAFRPLHLELSQPRTPEPENEVYYILTYGLLDQSSALLYAAIVESYIEAFNHGFHHAGGNIK